MPKDVTPICSYRLADVCKNKAPPESPEKLSLIKTGEVLRKTPLVMKFGLKEKVCGVMSFVYQFDLSYLDKHLY